MLGVKKLDIFVVKNFSLLFFATFFICLFIYIMQFLFRYIDDLVGKGLSMEVMAKFLWYAALSLVPMSLPLAILLAALMSFGNLGEKFELLAMKAMGISLLRIMAPLIIASIMLGGMSFYFQNVVAPYSQVKLWTLLFSMKQKSPELDIPEGQFYDKIDGYNLYVSKKNKLTGELYDVMIYNFSDGFENAHIIVADSAKLEMTSDKKYLRLHLYGGEQFENLRSQSAGMTLGHPQNVPYRRESFDQKHVIIDFNANFNMVDQGFMNDQYQSKNMQKLQFCIDSMRQEVDSVGRILYKGAMATTYSVPGLTKKDTLQALKSKFRAISADSVLQLKPPADREHIYDSALQFSSQQDWQFKGMNEADTQTRITRYDMEWHRRISLSIACVVFFFIGAPLGGIIRKGGLGMPVVISVLFFIFYYVIDTTGYKLAKTGALPPYIGMWLSTVVVALIGVFLTYKSNNDSVILNADLYRKWFFIFFGFREKRKLFMKDVIIEEPDYLLLNDQITDLIVDCKSYAGKHKLGHLPNYARLYLTKGQDDDLIACNRQMEKIVEDYSNCRDARILDAVEKFPILSEWAHRSPWRKEWLNVTTGIIFPVGIFFYIRACRFRFRLYRDLKQIVRTCEEIQSRTDRYIINNKGGK